MSQLVAGATALSIIRTSTATTVKVVTLLVSGVTLFFARTLSITALKNAMLAARTWLGAARVLAPCLPLPLGGLGSA
jgi:predicted lipid carrier protein YhbT